MSDIEVSKTFVITEQKINDSTTFKMEINSLGFVPDCVKLKNIAYSQYNNDGAGTGLWSVTTNLTNNVIFTFAPQVSVYETSSEFFLSLNASPDIFIQLKNGVQSQTTFQFKNITGTTEGNISIVVEFIKHKQKK